MGRGGPSRHGLRGHGVEGRARPGQRHRTGAGDAVVLEDLKEHEIAHRDEDVTIAGFHLGRRGMMRLENASVRMAVDRLHALGIP